VLDFTFDATVTRRDAGRIEIWVEHHTELNNGIFYNIIRTNPSDRVRNIRIFEARYEQYYQYFPFNPLFLEQMKDYQNIRFMPWSNTETVGPIDWSDRTTEFDYTFNLKTGVSLESQVLLINTLGSNPWFNIPYQATDNYITQFALYIRDHLRPDVKIYIEQGNECWGLGTHCGIYAQEQGLLQNLTVRADKYRFYDPSLQGRICFHIKQGQHYINIIKSIFEQKQINSSNRIKHVINTQVAWSGPIEVFFLCNGDYYRSYDIVAMAPYLSYDLTDSNGNLLYSVDNIFDSIVDIAINNSVHLIKTISSLVKLNAPNMQLALYEAGPDFSSLTDTGNLPLTNLSFFIHRDPRMKDALIKYFNNLTQNADFKLSIIDYFASVGQCSRYGCWGMIESSDANLQTSPKWLAYHGIINESRVCIPDEIKGNCENDCNQLGICIPQAYPYSNSLNDTCYCYFGYNGTDCGNINYIISADSCTYQCGGRGVCAFSYYDGFYAIHTCHCDAGYYGNGCDLFNCTNDCNWNGLCVDIEKCECYRGFNGSGCENDCGCNGHGQCNNITGNGSCICDPGYSFINNTCQLDCSQSNNNLAECLKCNGDCRNGTCLNGVCKCWAGYKYDIRGFCTIKTNAPNDGSKLG